MCGIHILGFCILCIRFWLICIPEVYLFRIFVYFVYRFAGFCIPPAAPQQHVFMVSRNNVKVFRNRVAGATTFLQFHAIMLRFSETVVPTLQCFCEFMQLCYGFCRLWLSGRGSSNSGSNRPRSTSKPIADRASRAGPAAGPVQRLARAYAAHKSKRAP